MPRLSSIANNAAKAFGLGAAVPLPPYNIQYLTIAGGGATAYSPGNTGAPGGAGAGGYLTNTHSQVAPKTVLNITVGGGGPGATSQGRGANGVNSVLSGSGLSTITSIGGGNGGMSDSPPLNNGAAGGSDDGVDDVVADDGAADD